MVDWVRRYIKTSIVFLFAGLLSGAYMVILRDILGTYPPPMLITAHVHVILVGFMMMMIMGVALWMFPKPRKEFGHYHRGLPKGVYWIMVVSTAFRFAGEVLKASRASGALDDVVAAAAMLQVLGMVLFFVNIWSRVRPPGSRPNPGGGRAGLGGA